MWASSSALFAFLAFSAMSWTVALVPCAVASKATRFTFPALSGRVIAASAPGWFWMVMVNCLVLAMNIPPACMADYKAAISNWQWAIGKSRLGHRFAQMSADEKAEWPRMRRMRIDTSSWQLAKQNEIRRALRAPY